MQTSTSSKNFTLGDAKKMSLRSKSVILQARAERWSPDTVKHGPLFSVADIETISGVSGHRVRQVLRESLDKDENPLPQGRTREELGEQGEQVYGRGLKRYFNAEEHSQILRRLVPDRFRKEGVAGVVASIFNYKGGVSKSTSTACIAQALSRLGYTVALLDLDPQGSVTNLFGYMQSLDVDTPETAYPVLSGETNSFLPNIRKTYWPGIDIIPSGPGLQSIEARFAQDLDLRGHVTVMTRMQAAMKELRESYDFVLIDTPPSLNNLACHALLNSDGVLIPCPPASVDLASLSMVWDLYLELCESLGISDDDQVIFKFLRVFATKCEMGTSSARKVLQWLELTYGNYMSVVRVPKSAAVVSASEAFATVFDYNQQIGNSRTSSGAQVREAYIQIANELLAEAKNIWNIK